MKPFQLLPALLVGVVLIACKKGDEDPFFTLASRKARISGEWKMTGYESEWLSVSESDTISSGTETGDENQLVRTWMFYDQENTLVSAITEYSYTINRDGTWSAVIDVQTVRTVEDAWSVATTPASLHSENSGTWAFVNKTKDLYKNKERVDFYTLRTVAVWQPSVTTTVYKDTAMTTTENNPGSSFNKIYTQGESLATYDLLMLKSKEMKWVKVSGSSYTSIDETGTYQWGSNSSEQITWQLK